MLKQTVSYFYFDDNPSQETLYFNLTKTELADNIHLRDELEEMQQVFTADKKELSTGEISQLIDLVKTIMRLSYGIRSADGKRFIKSEEQWTEFTQTAAYDAFLYSLFEDPNKAVLFMTGILPKDVRSAVDEEIAKTNPADDISRKMSEFKTAAKEASKDDETPAYVRENRAPTSQELITMSVDEIIAAQKWANENDLT